MNSVFWGFRDNYVHLFGKAFGNVIQPETEPSISTLLNWNTKVVLYDKSKPELRKCELNTVNSLNDTLPNVFSWFFAQKLALLMVVCYLEALKNQRSSETWLVHPSFAHLWSRWKFLEKIGNIFLYHLVGLSSCDTRFEGEKWELSQLEYYGEMQLFQKDFDMKKTYVDALLARKTYKEYSKTCQSLILIQNVSFLTNLNHKTYVSYI